MKNFLKRWYDEFKNEQAIKNPLQSTMMTKEEVSDALISISNKTRSSNHNANNNYLFSEEDNALFRDSGGNPDRDIYGDFI